YNGTDEYLVRKSVYEARRYDIEPDMSAACYFYAMAAANGISAVVWGVHSDIMQGDKKFLDVLCDMGCEMEETPAGIMLTGNGTLKGIDVDMSDFSDQAMTLAAIAPFAESEVNIRNVGHIRNQECDRLEAIDTALRKMGVETAVRDDGILIRPSKPAAADIETFEDHRIAMAFAVTGTVYGNINICNPQCCEKTFPEFFNILDLITEREIKDEKDN
ncbi:MAG: 3-phosphoshikimate 1-carboxyvinyltransferase, partial [Lachnospiraceae bacterium]|nr:3-phosphoshikimate 1-carboxyvinyltransferase [Lachnospiraceae bacterium]